MDSTIQARKRHRRPNFPLDFKLRLVQASLQPGVSIAQLAREHDLNDNLLFNWRKQYHAGQLKALSPVATPVLLPVKLPTDESGLSPSMAGEIELILPKGRVRRQGRPDPDTLRLLLQELCA